MLRNILGTIAGLAVAILVITLVQMVSSSMYPMPEGLEMSDQEGFAAYIKTLPTSAFLIVLLGYVLGSIAGGFVSTFVAKTKYVPALIVGLLLTIASILNSMSIPQPMWVSALSIIVMIPGAYLGAKLVKTA